MNHLESSSSSKSTSPPPSSPQKSSSSSGSGSSSTSSSSSSEARNSFEHWIKPSSNPKLSFFKTNDKSNHTAYAIFSKDDVSKISQHDEHHHMTTTTTTIFSLPYPVVYRFLTFFEVKEVLRGFYPTCRGFGEIVQSLSYSWWYDRLFDTLFPNPLQPLATALESDVKNGNSASSSSSSSMTNHHHHHHPLSKHERIQQSLRENALRQLHSAAQDFIVSQKALCVEPSSLATEPRVVSKLQIAQLCHFYQHGVTCSACHFPVAANFVVRNHKQEYLEGKLLEKKVDEWNEKYAQISAYVLRGTGLSILPKNKIENNDSNNKNFKNTKAAKRLVDGVFYPHSWMHLHSLEANHHIGDSEIHRQSGSVVGVNPVTKFMNTCRICKKQHQFPISSFDSIDPDKIILPHVDNGGGDEDDDDDDDDNDESKNSNNSNSPLKPNKKKQEVFPPLSYPEKFRDALTTRLLQNRQVSIQHEAMYWALVNGSIITKNMIYTFVGEKRTSTFSRITNPITCRSVEFRSFFRYVADSFPRFYCQITCYFHGLKIESVFAARRRFRQNYSNHEPGQDDDEHDDDGAGDNDENDERGKEYFDPDCVLSAEDEEYFQRIEAELARSTEEDNNCEDDDNSVNNDDDDASSSSDSSSSSEQNEDDKTTTTKDKSGKRKKKKKKNRRGGGLLQLDNDRPLRELHSKIQREKKRIEREKLRGIQQQKRDKRHAKLREQLNAKKSGIARFPLIKNELEEKFNVDADLCRTVFFAGYGRVELDKTPRIHLHCLKQVADHLGLQDDFPMFLLWNAIVHSCGFAADYLPFAYDVKLMHRISLENMFDEASAD